MNRVPRQRALPVAQAVLRDLAPYCTRIEIAGSLRRGLPTVGDIEIVAIPKTELEPIDLWRSVPVPCRAYCALVDRWPRIKGFPTGRYTQRLLPSGIKLDLFHADRDNWGFIYAIRTGSARWCQRVLAPAWVRAGYRGRSGQLNAVEGPVTVREERDLFKLINLPWIEPADRRVPVFATSNEALSP